MSVSHEHELPLQGVGELDDAVAEATAGETVYLTRDGEPVAAVVPPTVATAVQRQDRAAAVLAGFVARFGAPSLEHYRQVLSCLGVEWPGDDVIRQRYPVSAA